MELTILTTTVRRWDDRPGELECTLNKREDLRRGVKMSALGQAIEARILLEVRFCGEGIARLDPRSLWRTLSPSVCGKTHVPRFKHASIRKDQLVAGGAGRNRSTDSPGFILDENGKLRQCQGARFVGAGCLRRTYRDRKSKPTAPLSVRKDAPLLVRQPPGGPVNPHPTAKPSAWELRDSQRGLQSSRTIVECGRNWNLMFDS